jgi:hypothetical protein
LHWADRAAVFVRAIAGRRRLATMAMTAMTTIISVTVKPDNNAIRFVHLPLDEFAEFMRPLMLLEI